MKKEEKKKDLLGPTSKALALTGLGSMGIGYLTEKELMKDPKATRELFKSAKTAKRLGAAATAGGVGLAAYKHYKDKNK